MLKFSLEIFQAKLRSYFCATSLRFVQSKIIKKHHMGQHVTKVSYNTNNNITWDTTIASLDADRSSLVPNAFPQAANNVTTTMREYLG
jgi:hypothetical protein